MAEFVNRFEQPEKVKDLEPPVYVNRFEQPEKAKVFEQPAFVNRFDASETTIEEDTLSESIIKGGARGFRFLPNAVVSGLEIVGVDDTFLEREMQKGEKFVTGRSTNPVNIIAGEIAAGVTQFLSVAGTAGVAGGMAGAAIGGTTTAASTGASIATTGVMGIGSGLGTYKREIDAGTDPVIAAKLSVVDGTLAILTEAVPTSKLFRADLTGLKKFVQVVATDMFGEELELIGNTLADKYIADRPLPAMKDFVKEAAMTAAVLLGASGILSAGSDIVMKGLPQKEKIKSTPEAELSLEYETKTPKPDNGDNLIDDETQGIFENERAPMDITNNAQNERGKREVLDDPSAKEEANKTYKQLVQDGSINELSNVDINNIEKEIMFPHTIAKKFTKFKAIYERALRLGSDIDSRASGYSKIYEPYLRLKDKKTLNKLMLEEYIDRGGNVYSAQERAQRLTPEEELAWKAFRTVAMKAKNDLGEVLIELNPDKKEDIIKFINALPDSYVPLSRFGKYQVHVADRTGNTVEWSFHDSKKAMRKAAIKQQGKGVITTGKVKQTSSQLLNKLPVNILASLKAFDKELDVDFSKVYGSILGRGFPTHLLQSKKTAGFEQDLNKSMSGYLLSISKYMERKRAKVDFAQLLAKIDPKVESNLFTGASKYVDYITNHVNELSKFRQWMFRYYLGANLKSALVNATQTLTTTFPSFSKYVNTPSIKLVKAMEISTQSLESIGKRDPKLAEALNQAIFDGVISEQFVTMLRGGAYQSLNLNRVDNALSFFFNHVEVFNRKVSFIAAYKAATTDGVKIKDVDGKKRKVKLSHAEAIQFGENFIRETQFEYSRADRPAIAIGLKAPLFTFRIFTGNYLSMLKNFVTEGEYAALGRALGIITALGGLTAVPGVKDLEKALEAAGFDPKKQIKDYAGEYGDLMLHGALFPTGVDISGAIGTLEMVPNDIQQGAWPAIASIILGVPTDLPKRINRAFFFAHDLRDPWRAVEAIMPEAVRNPMVAIKWVREGAARTPFGEPIAKPGIGSVLLKAASIQPSILTRAYEREHSERLLTDRARQASANVSFRIARAIFRKDKEGLRKLFKQVSAHNAATTVPSKLIIINEQSIKNALANMIMPESGELKRLPKRARQEFLEIQETYRGEK